MASHQCDAKAIVGWKAGNPASSAIWLEGGSSGAILAPANLDGQRVDVVTALDDDLKSGLNTPDEFNGVSLLAQPKALAVGTNALTDEELWALRPAGRVCFVLDTAPTEDVEAELWWQD